MQVGYPFTYRIIGECEEADELDALVKENLDRLINSTHPAISGVLAFFSFSHLSRDALRYISRIYAITAIHTVDQLEDTKSGAEVTVALRKLLEAKDAAVRAAI